MAARPATPEMQQANGRPSVTELAEQEYPLLVGGMHARWTLDSLAETAYAGSRECVARPDVYKRRDIPEDIIAMGAE